MKPKSPESSDQNDLFRTRLTGLLDPRHELYRLADLIDWLVLDQELGQYFAADTGAPALPTRLLAGLHYLKQAFALSDEEVVARWVENPYWQYFCGEEFFRHEFPCHPTSLTKWRQRIGEAGCEWLLSVGDYSRGCGEQNGQAQPLQIRHRRQHGAGKSRDLSDRWQAVRALPAASGPPGR